MGDDAKRLPMQKSMPTQTIPRCSAPNLNQEGPEFEHDIILSHPDITKYLEHGSGEQRSLS